MTAAFKKGDRVKAEVVESFGDSWVICAFDGALMGLRNDSGRRLEEGEAVELIVADDKPLSFRLAAGRAGLDHFG